MKELINIQKELRAPKGQRNDFGRYNFRSCEDILEAVKPLLYKNACTLLLSDEIILIGDRYYVRATATITNVDGEAISTSASAREETEKKGLDASQITGSASSYARKYALNGLFCIDDTKDADATNNGDVFAEIASAKSQAELVGIYNSHQELQTSEKFLNALSTRRKEIKR